MTINITLLKPLVVDSFSMVKIKTVLYNTTLILSAQDGFPQIFLPNISQELRVL